MQSVDRKTARKAASQQKTVEAVNTLKTVAKENTRNSWNGRNSKYAKGGQDNCYWRSRTTSLCGFALPGS